MELALWGSCGSVSYHKPRGVQLWPQVTSWSFRISLSFVFCHFLLSCHNKGTTPPKNVKKELALLKETSKQALPCNAKIHHMTNYLNLCTVSDVLWFIFMIYMMACLSGVFCLLICLSDLFVFRGLPSSQSGHHDWCCSPPNRLWQYDGQPVLSVGLVQATHKDNELWLAPVRWDSPM